MSDFAATLLAPVRRHSTATTALVVLVAVWGWQLAVLQNARELSWMALTAFSVLSGFVALGWLRPARVGITAPQAMMLLGTAGMLAGLSIDVQRAGLAAIASMCATRAPDFIAVAKLHFEWLPAMHIGMVAGGFGALVLLRRMRPGCRRQFCARFLQNMACSAWMIAGMVAGVVLYYQLAAWFGTAGVAAMLGGMIGGMVWGMVASVSIYRLYANWLDGPAGAPGSPDA